MANVTIIQLPTNLGLKEPGPGHEPGVKKLPDWLRKHGFHDRIDASGIFRLNPPPYSMQLDEASGVRNAEAIIAYAKEQAALLNTTFLGNTFSLLIGGDCSIMIGTALALKKTGNYALFYLDGHTDFMLPALSSTGGAAGMDLAIITGYGHPSLTNIDGLKPYIQESMVWCVGNREYDPSYVQPILDSAITYYDLKKLRQVGITSCVEDFLQLECDGFWIHLDVDVLNDDIMPAVDSREKDGLSYEELDQILQLLLSHPKAAGIEITILDPDLDPTGEITENFVDAFCKTFNSVKRI